MRISVAILLVFLVNLKGCVNHSVSEDIVETKTESTVYVDSLEADLMNLYSATAATRYAVQPESAVYSLGLSVRISPNRIRTVSNVSTRQVLLLTHKPLISRLIHQSVTHLIAFPKEYHIFQLRRILI